MRYYSPFPEAIPQKRAYSHALLTRPPLTPKGALDLHVLGLPPAFVLSQDQTLKLKSITAIISLTFEPLHIFRLRYRLFGYLSTIRQLLNTPTRLGQSTIKSHLFVCFRSPKKPKATTNSEADTLSSALPLTLLERKTTYLRARYTDIQSVENEPNRPHISSVIHQCQRTKHSEPKNQTITPIPQRHRPIQTSECPQSLLSVTAVSPACPAVSPTRQQHPQRRR